jgi:protein subunit release factor B
MLAASVLILARSALVRPLKHHKNLSWRIIGENNCVGLRTSRCFIPSRSFASFEDPDNVRIPVPEIPKEKLDIKFVKASSGPGGQNVNKLNTKAEVRFKPKDADWIPKVMIDRFIELNATKINKDGEIVITSIRHRLQAHNLKDCLEKLREYLEEAAIIPKERIATEMPEYAKQKRLSVCISASRGL